MSKRKFSRLFNRIHRLVFLYIFRDFDKGTLDTGLEFTTLIPLGPRKILCQAITLNIKGLKRDNYVVDRSTRRILNLPGRYICYWIDRKRRSTKLYNRTYRKASPGTYVHNSRNAMSHISFDAEGLEKRAENLVFRPRSYHEVYQRVLRF